MANYASSKQARGVGNLTSQVKNGRGFGENYSFLKSNTWAVQNAGGMTKDFLTRPFFNSFSSELQGKIRKTQQRIDQTEKQVRSNNWGTSLVGNGNGTSMPVAHGKQPSVDYHRLTSGMKAPKFDWQEISILIGLGILGVLILK